jgi:RNA polymerase sigma factor (sigma-70 family)
MLITSRITSREPVSLGNSEQFSHPVQPRTILQGPQGADGVAATEHLSLFKRKISDEDELIKGCIAGKREMQKQLYDRYAAKMLAICRRYAQTSFEAEDILQESFVKVFTHLGDFKRDCPVEYWIRRIIINTAIKHQRGTMQVSALSEEENPGQVPQEEFIMSNYGYEELLGMVRSLAPRYQMIFNLFAIEGYSHKEIAEMLGISEGTSKSQYSRARAILKNMLERHEKQCNEKIINK